MADPLELVFGGYAAWERGDYETILGDIYAPDAVYDMTTSGVPDQGEYRGTEEIRRAFEQWDAVFGHVDVEIQRVVARGNTVCALLRQSGKGLVSGTPVTLDFAQVTYIEEGQVKRVNTFTDREAALRSVGMDPALAEVGEERIVRLPAPGPSADATPAGES